MPASPVCGSPMKIALYILLFYFGAIWGSFFFTLAARYSNRSIRENWMGALFTASRCPGCDSAIPWYHLVPIFGYVLARGRCGSCGMRISPQYPAAEIGFGVLILLFYLEHGATLYSLNLYLLSCVSMTIALIDAKTLSIPNSLVAALLVLSIYPMVKHDSIADPLLGLALMAGFFIVILLVFPGSFGGGDVKMASAMGLLLGLKLSIVALETAILAGAIYGTAYAIAMKKSLRSKIPFAPFLCLGLVVALLYGRDILLVYTRTVLR